MPLTAIDPKTALIVIDLQKGIIGFVSPEAVAGVIANAATLTEAFRKHNLPVVLVNVTGTPTSRTEQSRSLRDLPADWADLIPQLNHQPTDHTVTKKTWGAFTNTDLDQYLKSQGVTQVVVTGVATSAGVESTARFAHELGYNVTLVTDAMTDMNPDAHTNSITRIFPRLGETGTTQEILALLNKSNA